MKTAPTGLDVPFYHENGYLLLESGIPESELHSVERSILEIFERQDRESESFRKTNRYRRFASELHLSDALFARFVQSPCFYRIAKAILGENADMRFSSTITKTRESGNRLDWHQDSAYDRDANPYLDRITCWTAISAATAGNGCLRIIPGSHRRGLLPHSVSKAFPPDLECASLDETEAEIVEMAPGQILVIHPLLLHASGKNESGPDRVAMMVGYQIPKPHYEDKELKWGYRFIRDGEQVWEKL